MFQFIKLLVPFILLFFVDCPGLDYSHAIKRWPQTLPSKEMQEKGMDEFKAGASLQMGRESAQKLDHFIRRELPSGSCYGQSYVFMMLNPAKAKQITFPTAPKDQRQIVWFQAKLAAIVYLNPQYQALRNQAIQTAWQGFPTYNFNEISDDKLIELLSRLGQQKPFKEGCRRLENEFKALQPGLAFWDNLETEEAKLLRERGIKFISDVVIRQNETKNSDFKQAFQKKLEQIYKEKTVSDLIVGFDFDYQGGRGGHAILIQLKHLRVYDAMHGIFQYSSFEDLKNDLKISQQKGCSYFHLNSFISM